MPANAIIVFNNYILHLPLWWSLSKWSPLWEDTMFTRMYGLLKLNNTILSLSKKGSFFERTIWPIADLYKMSNSRTYSIFCCEFSYPWLIICKKFLICALCHCPFLDNGFYHWFILSLIVSVCEYSMVCVKDPLEFAIGKTASPWPRLLSSFTRMSTLKYLLC